ncbi:Hypp1073 [Branchiostoma lanceolatum]|uniref:Hypp1073 protein n=1 Tax=Branchiostoma lanceolatum TaxID=7740 RepID=A0A8J9ZEN1_BRALA|nr:Hypp1073 [Branchiostoma lanceolatum]
MGRRLRTRLPTTNAQLMPRNVDHKNVKLHLEARQHKQKNWYDKSARSLPTLSTGDTVRVQQQDESATEAKDNTCRDDNGSNTCT